MLHILDPREERKLVENQEVPVYGGGVLLYNLAPKKALSGQRYEVTGDKLRLLSGNTEALLVVDKKKSEMQYLYRCEAGKGDSVAARLEFKKPQCIVFEDSSFGTRVAASWRNLQGKWANFRYRNKLSVSADSLELGVLNQTLFVHRPLVYPPTP